MMDKAADAFRTISEVAEDLDVPQHVLRFWETKFPHIKPLKRGGGRRYYRPDDVDLVRGIRYLLYGQGYTIKGVQRIIKEEGVKKVMGAWKNTGENAESIQFLRNAQGNAQGHAQGNVQGNAQGNAHETGTFEADPLEDSAQVSEELIVAIETYDIDLPTVETSKQQGFLQRSDVSIMRGGLGKATHNADQPHTMFAPSALSEADHKSLMGVLQDLAECRRILDAAGRI